MTRNPHVAVIVLSYNGRDDTLACLDSLADVSWAPLTVVLVDNGSQDGTVEAVRVRHASVNVLSQERNLGFAEGNNVGIRWALELGAEFVFLLNNDTTIAPDSIGHCVEVAQAHADAAAVCPLIYFTAPPDLIWYAGAVFDPKRAHSGRMLGYREVDRHQFTAISQTDRVAGAAVLLSSAVLGEVGLLDSELFFLYEDVDWSLRARRAGHGIYVAPRARVWHRVSSSAGGEHSPTIAYYDTRNHLLICERHAPLPAGQAVRRAIGILVVHLAGARRARRSLPYLRAVLKGWRDGRRGRTGPNS